MKTSNHLNPKLFIPLFLSVIFIACSEDEEVPELINQEELITTVKLELTDENTGNTYFLVYRDIDGGGPTEAEITTDTLPANTVLNGHITLLNETLNPPENISTEVKEEGLDHQFFFSNTFGATITYKDTDSEGNPIGLDFQMETADPATGSLTVILRHEPDKNASGVSNGNIDNAGGSTDLSVTFPVTLE